MIFNVFKTLWFLRKKINILYVLKPQNKIIDKEMLILVMLFSSFP